MAKKKKIGIVILHYKNIKDTKECLKSVSHAEKKDLDVKVFLIKNTPKKNLGFAGGNNLGIKKALKWGADYLILLNNDTKVSKKLFINLTAQTEANKKIGILSPKIYFEKGYEFHKKRYKKADLGRVIWYAGGKIDWDNVYTNHRGVDEVDHGQYNKLAQTELASGCCMLIKPFVFKRIGFLDKKYFLYWEDADFCIRAKSAGIEVFYTPKAYLWHKNAGGSSVGSALHDYYMTRNRLLFGFRYAPFRTKLALSRESIKKLLAGRKWERIGVKDFWLKRLGKGSYRSNQA